MIKFSSLKHKHANKDIFVLCSGKSLEYVSPRFFRNKIVVCLNYTVDYIDKTAQTYVIAKEPAQSMQDSAKEKNAILVIPPHWTGQEANELNKIYYPEITSLFKIRQGSSRDKEQSFSLEFGASTIVSAIHFAAYLGSKDIILVGHDCGFLNNCVHVNEYNKDHAPYTEEIYPNWMVNRQVEQTSIFLKKNIKKVFETNVYSINPFINFNLENNDYLSFRALGRLPMVQPVKSKERDKIKKNKKLK